MIPRNRRHDRSRRYWHSLTPREKYDAILNLLDGDVGEYTISSATGLSVEAIRQLLAERNA